LRKSRQKIFAPSSVRKPPEIFCPTLGIRTDRLLGDVVREGHTGVGGKAPDIVGILAQPCDQVGRFALLDAPALTRGARAWVFAFTLAQNRCD
jgi:hypothetical protein